MCQGSSSLFDAWTSFGSLSRRRYISTENLPKIGRIELRILLMQFIIEYNDWRLINT